MGPVSVSFEEPGRLVQVLTDAAKATAVAEGGTPVVVADPDGVRSGAAAAAVERGGGRAACFAVGDVAAGEERAAVEAMAAECLGASEVVWR